MSAIDGLRADARGQVYVFGPTYLFDGETTKAGSKAVGLTNPANDCFINSILQALAGLPDLRLYLIREVHRRKLDGPAVYRLTEEDFEDAEKGKGKKPWELESLRKGSVTRGLKDILDKLNERPIYRKIISAQDFIRVLEIAFKTRISRQQQDAQEFLQVVVERVCDEYHAGHKARQRAGRATVRKIEELEQSDAGSRVASPTAGDQAQPVAEENEATVEDGFPFEGKLESRIECETCGFKPKPSVSTFVTLTLNVSAKSNTTLNQCFDGLLKVEKIEDFKCDKCRLNHALRYKKRELATTSDSASQEKLAYDIGRIQEALENDPEQTLDDIQLPDLKLAPKSRIQRHMRISSFPKILAIHLSRSMYSAVSLSSKNTAKVAFPETLPLGGILDQHRYRLVSVVCHKGGHDTGHYETYRRQIVAVPISTPTSFGTTGVYSNRGTPAASVVPSPRLSGQSQVSHSAKDSPLQSSSFTRLPEQFASSISPSRLDSPSSSSLSSRSSLSMSSRRHPKRASTSASLHPGPTSAPRPDATPPASPSASTAKPATRSPSRSPTPLNSAILSQPPTPADIAKLKKKHRKANSRWWRISDEKVKECSTSQVLGMQKEVYLLFYELDQEEEE